MRKLFTIAFAIILFRSLSIAQFEFPEDCMYQNIFTEKSAMGMNVIIDSLMMDSIFTEYVASNSIPGLATLAVKENQVIWNKNYGYRNLGLQLPVNDSTIFRLASVSKTIVATAVMQLWENGMIDLEANVNDYLPAGFTVINPFHPNNAITIRMLLTHTSSIRDNSVLNSSLRVCGDSPIELDTFLVNFLTPGGVHYNTYNYIDTIPGQLYYYSNVGASLLAYIVQLISGKSFSDYCRDSIFIPLSMNTSSWFLEGMDTTNMAIPYNGSIPLCHQGAPFYPSGFLRANKLELLNFLSAYLNNGDFNNFRLLDSTTVSYMLSDQLGYVIDGVKIQGLIWFVVLPVDSTVWGHDGSSPGVGTYIGINPLENYGLILLQNRTYSLQDFLELVIEFKQYAHSYEMTPVISINPTELNFGEVPIDSSESKTFTITNTGNMDLVISNISSSDPVFTVNITTVTIPPGTSQEIEVTFTPTVEQTYTGIIEITHNAEGSPDSIMVTGEGVLVTRVKGESQPIVYDLEQNYPNPFNPATVINYSVPKVSKVILKLYNLLGEEVAVLVNEEKAAGYYKVEFNTKNLSSGVYFYQLRAGTYTAVKKMILMK